MKLPSIRFLLSRKFWQRVTFGLVCLATVVAAVYPIENLRGRRAWERYRAEAAARGVKLDVRELAPAPVPDAENFASAPQIAALYLLDGKVAPRDAEPMTEEKKRGVVVDLALPDQVLYIVYRALQEGGRGLDLGEIQKAFVKIGYLKETTNDPAADILRALERFEPAMQELRLAAKRPKSQFPPWSGRRTLWVGGFFRLMKFVNFRVEFLLAAGRHEEAAEEWKIQLQLCEALKSEPTLLAAMMRVTTIAYNLPVVVVGAADHAWNEPELEAFVQDLGRLRLAEDFPGAFNTERAVFNSYFDVIKTNPKFIGLPAWIKYLPQGWFDQNLINYNRMADARVLWAESDGKAGSLYDFKQRAAAHWWGWHPYWFIGNRGYVMVEPACRQCWETDCRLQVCRVACALERFRLQNGAYPDRLDQLEPALLPMVPKDRYTHQPFHYENDAQGAVLVYSCGPNGRDDRGADDDIKWRSNPIVASTVEH